MLARRPLLLSTVSSVLAACVDRAPADHPTGEAPAPGATGPRHGAALEAIERSAGGRLGAHVIDTATGRGFGWRDGERFGMCSTFKLSLAALVLREADAGRLRLDEILPYGKADLMDVSPVTTAHVGEGGMTVGALAEATQITSDNAAANLLLRRLGGPQALTRFWRELGDEASRLDRFEPELNLVTKGDARDTVVPSGIARSVAEIVTGSALTETSRARLLDWMIRTETGKRRIRASIPDGWRAGDKTGTGIDPSMANKTNDIAVLLPPDRPPLVVVAFYESDGFHDDLRPRDEAVLAAVGAVAVASIG